MNPHRWALLGLLLLACGPRTYAVRLKHAERLGDQVQRELDEAQRAEVALDTAHATESLASARKLLDDPDAALYPDSALLEARYQELAEALPGTRGTWEQQHLEQRLDGLRDKVVPAAQRTQEALAQLPADAPTDAQLEAVESPAREVLRRLDISAGLFAQDPGFAAWSRSQRAKADKALAAAALARSRRAFLQGPGSDLEEAAGLVKAARAEREQAKRQELLGKAQDRSRRCAEAAGRAAQARATGPAPLRVAGKAQTPAQVARTCGEVRVAAAKALAREQLLANARVPRGRR